MSRGRLSPSSWKFFVWYDTYATIMATSSLLLLRRCLWYRHTRWPTSSSMILLRYSGRRFVTTIVVGSQGYVEYRAPAHEIKIYYSVYVHRIITIRLQRRCHHRLWTIYMYVCLGGTLFGQCGTWFLHSSQWWYVCIQNIRSFINHLHEQYFAYQLPCNRFND